MRKIPKINNQQLERVKPEIFIGLVSAAGTDLRDLVSNALQDALEDVGYDSEIFHLSKYLPRVVHNIVDKRTRKEIHSPYDDKRIGALMNAGDKFREKTNDGSAVVILAIDEIRAFRNKEMGSEDKPIPNFAYILRSLKRPEEVKKLREIYGSRFLLISAYSPRQTRVQKLATRIADSYLDSETNKYREKAEGLIQRDENDPTKQFGQNVRKTFPRADLFVDASRVKRSQLKKDFTRFFELFLGDRFNTPSRDEYGMFLAYASSLKSSSPSLRVGAAIATEDGDVIALGTNEVPKTGGGLYDADDHEDYRDFMIGYEMNAIKKRQLLTEVLHYVIDKMPSFREMDNRNKDKHLKTLLKEAFRDRVQLTNLLEFGRPVHAEMAALIDASRRTVSVKGCTLYTTTFPCHICAKHIVAAGITRVVYIEPYPKSLAQELFFDSLVVDNLGNRNNRVRFESFVGISPLRYVDLFSADDLFSMWDERMTEEGKIIRWDLSQAKVRFDESDKSYLDKEDKSTEHLGDVMEKEGIIKIPIAKYQKIMRKV